VVRKSETPTKAVAFVLPTQLTGRTDINRLLRELETLDETLIGQEAKEAPKITSLLDQTAAANGYKLLEQTHRHHIAEQLTKIRDHAPLLHISFAAEPSAKVTETVLAWLRANIHRYALLQIGLQPAIAAGCVLRTPNKIFDMSLGASLQKQTPYLLELLKGAALDRPAPVATPSLPAGQAGKP
jgi:F0F1-type ATP synthase delta subunit